MYIVNNLLIETAQSAGHLHSAGRSSGRASLNDPLMAVALAAALAVAGGVSFVDYQTSQRYDTLLSEVGTALQDSTTLDENVELATQLRIRSAEVEQRIEMIRRIDQGRYTWSHIMDQVALASPADLWLNKWEETQEGTPEDPTIAFRIEGYAASNQVLADFIQTLEASPFIIEVSFSNSRGLKIGGQDAIQFTIDAKSEQPEESLIDLEVVGPEGRKLIPSQSAASDSTRATGLAPGQDRSMPWLPKEELPVTVPKH